MILVGNHNHNHESFNTTAEKFISSDFDELIHIDNFSELLSSLPLLGAYFQTLLLHLFGIIGKHEMQFYFLLCLLYLSRLYNSRLHIPSME